MVVTVIILAIILLAYLGFMKFYYPKFKEQYEQNEQSVQKEWNEKKDEIISEYFTNPNKFGLISDVTENETIIGMMSGHLPEDFKSKLLTGLKDAAALTRSVDMSHYYLVATDKGLHYVGFDGEKCFLNEVFDYNKIFQAQTTKDSLTFEYKEEKLKFSIDNESPIAINGYPRFDVHERSKAATSNDRSLNYFVREYFAYEPTNNAHFKQSNQVASFNMDGLKVSPEKSKDFKVREYLVKEFKRKLNLY